MKLEKIICRDVKNNGIILSMAHIFPMPPHMLLCSREVNSYNGPCLRMIQQYDIQYSPQQTNARSTQHQWHERADLHDTRLGSESVSEATDLLTQLWSSLGFALFFLPRICLWTYLARKLLNWMLVLHD